MQIGSSGLLSSNLARSMSSLKSSFDDLTRQLSSGQVSTTYGGLGSGRTTALAMQAQISKLQGYSSAITNVNLRINTASTVLTRLSALGTAMRSDTNLTDNTLVAGGQTRAQIDARSSLDEALSLLGTEVGGSYLFGGRASDASPVATSSQILDGDGTKIGLRDLIAERRTADIGTVDLTAGGPNSVGRLTVSASSGTDFTVSQDSPDTSPFGFKLAGGVSSMSGATISSVAGSPPSLTVGMTANPNAGETMRLTMNLPDGTTQDITLAAVSGTPLAGTGQFAVGATPTDTLENMRTALVGSLDTQSQTSLSAASSVEAAQTFFAAGSSTPVQRVAFTPPATAATATATRDATPTDTVLWYTGDDDPSISARQSATTQIDTSLSVNYGVRANEQGVARIVRSLALYAAETFPASDPNMAGRNEALQSRMRTDQQPDSGAGSIAGITTELAGAQSAATAADTRHKASVSTAQDMVAGVEQSNDQTVAASLLAVQTRLQATYQTTAMLSKMTLVNFLGT